MTAAPVATPAAGKNGVMDGLWIFEMTGKTMSGSCRQLTSSGSDRRASDPGAPAGQSGIEPGCADSAAGCDGKAGPVVSRLILRGATARAGASASSAADARAGDKTQQR